MELVLIIILSIIGATFLAIAIFYIAKFMKGSVKIIIDKNSFKLGEEIKGTVELKCKKEIKSNSLDIFLKAGYYQRTGSGKSASTSYVSVIEVPQNLEKSRNYSVGTRQTYSFAIKIPAQIPQTPKTGNKFVDTIVSFAAHKKLYWEIYANLDAEGIDLNKTKKIHVDESPTPVINN